MATITGCVKKVRFYNPQTKYTVALMKSDNEYIATFYDTCNEGEKLILTGIWVIHKKYGRQFQADYIERNIDDMTCDDISTYIQNIKGIGPSRAGKIIKAFKTETINIMQKKPEKLKSVGIPKSVIENVKAEFKEDEAMVKLKQKLLPLGLTVNMIRKIYKFYKGKTMSQLRENPYKLADDIHGIGFKKADDIAMKLGIDPKSDFRIKACLKYILQQKAALGHSYLPILELVNEARAELQQFIPQDKIEQNIITHEHLIEDQGNVYLKYLYYYEYDIAKKLNKLMNQSPSTIKKVDKIIAKIEQNNKIKYTNKQKAAIKNTFLNPVSVITGGPGTGKTTIVKAILTVAQQNDLTVALAAPTGKAAKRMEETTDHEAKTIHRLLEFKPNNNDYSGPMFFQRNEHNPLDEDLVVIDESSMIDTVLMYNLIMAIDTRIVFIGDTAQLPSIGPGTVLADLIKNLPTTRLNSIFRQKDTSSIIINSQRIDTGQYPCFDKDDFSFYNYTCPEQIIDVFLGELEKEKTSIDEVQILTPMQKTDTGTNVLNRLIQECINPPSNEKAEVRVTNDKVFRVGDKVMQLRNNYNKECFNGDVGIIQTVIKEEDGNTVVVKFDDRMITFTEDEVRKDMELAYATTIHKSQGSEYKTVIIPILTSHFIMLKRNLIYTAVTRAKNKVIIVGQKKAIGLAVKTVDATKRYTSLSKRIREFDMLPWMKPRAFNSE